jgi:hypothetical protein
MNFRWALSTKSELLQWSHKHLVQHILSLDFNGNGNIYFVGIRSPTLWFGETNKMRDGTSEGISNSCSC